MNILLKDPFESNIPDEITHSLNTLSIIAKFNSTGRFMACGTRDGFIHIWDLEIYKVIKTVQHVSWITSIDFDNEYMISGSGDWNIIIWDWENETRLDTIRCTSPVFYVQQCPFKSSLIGAICQGQLPLLFEKDGRGWKKFELPLDKEGVVASTASFTPNGKFFYVGTNKGTLLAYSTSPPYALQTTTKITPSSLIKTLSFSSTSRDLLVNSSDRVIRSYSLKNLDLNLINKFQDSIDKPQWTAALISSDGEYVFGSSSTRKIYIWDLKTGVLVKQLDPHDGISYLSIHPSQPVLASTTDYGHVFLWRHQPQQKFAAYEPTFTELEDNLEYHEREDEFDEDATHGISKRSMYQDGLEDAYIEVWE